MFIGAGSGSTAGGIKISTFAVLLATAGRKLKGKKMLYYLNVEL